MQDFKLVLPQDTTWGIVGGDPNVGYNSRTPRYHCGSVQKGDNYVWEHVTYQNPERSCDYMVKEQQLTKKGDIQTKINTVKGDYPYKPVYKSVQIQTEDGFYSVARTKNGEVIGGYEIKPVNRKFAKSFKGKLQRAAMKLGTDANGCERPVLNRVSEFMLKVLKKVK